MDRGFERGSLTIGHDEYVVIRRDVYERETVERERLLHGAIPMKLSAHDDPVALPRGEVARLRRIDEDHADLLAYADFRKRLEEGAEERLPADLVKRMLDGEHPVRVWREHRGLTAAALAERAGVSAAYLSEIERHGKPGSTDAMKKLAEALDVLVDDLI